ncbi:MAG: 50S ribosomal protein L3 [Candidatus Micrarchaeaceae archaeon]
MHRGSLQYWHKRRAKNRLPRVRSPPNIKEPTAQNIVAYKVGMAHVAMIDDSESPSKNLEISASCTVLEVPQIEMYGARFYTRDIHGYRKAAFELHNKELARKLKQKATKNDETKLEALKPKLKEFEDITALLVAYPKGMSVGQHHALKFESGIGGTIEEKFDFVSARLGKEFKASEAFKSGEYVDISTVTKGKGWAGVIKRFGVARLNHKATNKIRHVGTHGAFTPGKVLFTVPMAGQLGFNYRTETNKRILKMGASSEVAKIIPKAGFTNYGNIKNDYLIIKGSVGGPSKRLVRVRKASGRNNRGIKEPKIDYISTSN